MKVDNRPIVLSGRVFFDKLLAAELPEHALDPSPKSGDIKLIALINSSTSNSQKKPARKFAGFFSAYIHNGKRWRKLAIRSAAATEATYSTDADRRNKALACLCRLKKLKGATAIWGNRAYEVHN